MKVCPKCGKQYGDDANFCTGDAGRLVAVAASGTGAVAGGDAGLIGGRFELGERIGGGATGDVHKATDRQGGQQVALKLIDPALTAQATTAQRIERELKLLERVQSPAVARVIASGKHGDRMWVATEWVANALPLDAALDAGAVGGDRAAAIALQVGGALVEAAKVGVVHRDLAPKNVLVGGDGVKVINFPLPVPGPRVQGVPGFVSPEAIEGKPIDQRSATYSLGAIYYAALTGAPPFQGDAQAVHAAQLTGSVQPPSSKVPLAPEIDSLVGRAMERNPAKRYLTLKQFLDDIEKVGKAAPVEPSPSTTQPFGRVGGRQREVASTMLGLGPIPGGSSDANELKTKQMDVQIPAEALREAAALYDAPPAVVHAPAIPAAPAVIAQAPSAPVPVAPPPEPVAPPPVIAQVAPPPEPVAPPPAPVAPPVHMFASQAAAPAVPAPAPAPMAAAVAAPSDPASPWAPPTVPPGSGPGPMTPAVQAVEAAAPAIGAIASAAPAPAPAAPVIPAAAPAAAAAGRSTTKGTPGGPGGKPAKGEGRDKKKKGQFRETLWFKKGDLDAVAAEEAARAKDGSVQDKSDSLPMEERYADDGTITSSDAQRYSLKTGGTSQMPVFRSEPGPGSSVSEGDLIGEMKSGRKLIFVAIGVGVLVIVAIVVLFAL